MEYYNQILCASSDELIRSDQNPNGFITYSGLHKMYSRSGTLKVVRRGKGKDNSLLVDFSSLPREWQNKLREQAISPELKADVKPFKDRIVIDQKAKDFFRDEYVMEDGKPLPDKLQKEYTNNASVLNAIHEVFTKATKARTQAGKNTKGFWKKVAEVIYAIRAKSDVALDTESKFDHSLPRNHRRLQDTYKNYINNGNVNYEYLVNGRIGNKNSEKITGDILEWLVVEMANGRQSIDMVAMRYPAIAKQNNWEPNISAMAFRKRISQPEVKQLIDLKRHGRKGFRKLYGQVFKLKKSQYSNDIWMGDGTALSWYYKTPVLSDVDGKTLHYKPVMATTYVVMDERSNKFLGWSTKEGINKENFEMQLEAFRASLRVAGTKPYQLLFDNQGGHKKTESKEFYSKLAHIYFPTRAYRASGKSVERAFKNFQTLKLAEFPFWSGFGRPSHSNLDFAPNMEDIKKNVDSLPTYEELIKLLDVTIAEWNELGFDGADCPNKIYEMSRNPEEQPLTIDEMADMFWNMQGPKKYYPFGIILQFKGEEVIYEVHDDQGNIDYNFRRKYLKQKFYLKYDPEGEYPEIELYQTHPTGGYQKIASAQKKREASRSVKYHNEGDKAWIEKQMALEAEMMDEMDGQMSAIGYSEEVKWNSWRNKIEDTQKQTELANTLYGSDDEGTMEIIK